MRQKDVVYLEGKYEDDVCFEFCNCVECRLARVEKELSELKKEVEIKL
jgi:hypothetical protein